MDLNEFENLPQKDSEISDIFVTGNEEIDALKENEGEQDKSEKVKFNIKNDVFEWLEIVVSAIVMLVIFFTFIFKVVTINGRSMNNTLFDGEKLIISNINYTPKRGDIVVISKDANHISGEDSGNSIIKRVIATEGQVVDIDFEKGLVYVDGVALSEPYTRTPTNLSYDISFPVTVKSGCVFVMGDNRNDSADSRCSLIGDEGMIDKRHILGKALFRIYPFSSAGGIY